MKLLYLTNIPAPYRIKRFNDLNTIMRDKGINLEVAFMSETEPDRNWIVDYKSMHFNYQIWPGIHPSIGGFYAHFNPTLLLRLLKHDYDYIVVAGMACPTLWIAKLFIPKSVKKIMSVESNLMGNTTKTGLKYWVKKILLRGYEAYQITGQPQREYIEYFSGTHEHYIILPNLIDSNVYNYHRSGERLSNDLSIIIPARLVSYKIPDQFMDAIADLKGVKFFVAGTGDANYEKHIRERIEREHLPMELLGFVQQEDMARLYNKVDFFCLPTQEDPSPLSPIEANACGLPVLVSKLAGNINEVLIEGKNGYGFDPYDRDDMRMVFQKALNLTKEERKAMSNAALDVYKNTFDNDICLNRYIDDILSIN